MIEGVFELIGKHKDLLNIVEIIITPLKSVEPPETEFDTNNEEILKSIKTFLVCIFPFILLPIIIFSISPRKIETFRYHDA